MQSIAFVVGGQVAEVLPELRRTDRLEILPAADRSGARIWPDHQAPVREHLVDDVFIVHIASERDVWSDRPGASYATIPADLDDAPDGDIGPVVPDWKLRKGLMGGELPQTTGREVAGVVDEVGEGVTDVAVGDRVFGFSAAGEGAAELALLADYAPIPPSLGFAEAAGLPVAIETATRTLDALGVGAGTTLLVNGAAGGVGSAAVQLAVARGARVIGTASPANHDPPNASPCAFPGQNAHADALVVRRGA